MLHSFYPQVFLNALSTKIYPTPFFYLSLKMKNLNLPTRLFHLFLFITGVSIGIFSTLCVITLSFSIPSLPIICPFPLSQSNPSTPTPPLLPEKPQPMAEKVIPLPSQGTSKQANISTNLSLGDDSLATLDPQVLLPPLSEAEITSYNSTNSVIDFSLGNNSRALMHGMNDEELLLMASRVQELELSGKDMKQKVAFMFLTPGPLPLAPFWDMFFKGHDGLYSIYVHPHPLYNDSSIDKDSAFYGRRIPSKPVKWGTISMVDAERRLLANALLDPSNQRFVILSDSCIPVFNFTTIYDYLIGADGSFVGIIQNPWKRSKWRYDRRMRPTFSINQWRKGSQWFSIRRDIAVRIVSDQKFYRAFHDYCPAVPCFSDEHYIQTLVNVLCPEVNSNRSLTWLDWSVGGGHPRRFGSIDVNVELVEGIRVGTECMYNGNLTRVCFLFARKFAPSAVGPLLKIGPSVLGF